MATGIGQYGFGAKLARYAEAGACFVGVTPTPGTGIIGHAAPTTFDEAKPYFVCYNGGTKNIYPLSLQLYSTVAGVGGARVQFTVTLDDGNRYSSAGTALTIANVNSGSAAASLATITVGAVVATAATSARRILGNYVFRGTIDIIEDSYELNFGGLGAGSVTGSRVATVADMARTVVPCVVAPGDSLLVTEWRGSQSTGPTFEVIFTYLEI
jgi:hypothetical protein